MAMEGCPRRSVCLFYLEKHPKPSYGILRKFYCRNAPQLCEIFKRAQRNDSVPLEMLPDGTRQGS
jgi:hypothetical protein